MNYHKIRKCPAGPRNVKRKLKYCYPLVDCKLNQWVVEIVVAGYLVVQGWLISNCLLENLAVQISGVSWLRIWKYSVCEFLGLLTVGGSICSVVPFFFAERDRLNLK